MLSKHHSNTSAVLNLSVRKTAGSKFEVQQYITGGRLLQEHIDRLNQGFESFVVRNTCMCREGRTF